MVLKSCLECFKDSKKPPHMEAPENWGWLYPQCAVHTTLKFHANVFIWSLSLSACLLGYLLMSNSPHKGSGRRRPIICKSQEKGCIFSTNDGRVHSSSSSAYQKSTVRFLFVIFRFFFVASWTTSVGKQKIKRGPN